MKKTQYDWTFIFETTLVSYVWTYNECGHVPYVAKTDDNVVMNVTRLLSILRTREAKDVNKWFIACSVPSRNIATGNNTILI